MDWINLAEDRVCWKIFMDTVMNFKLQKCNTFLVNKDHALQGFVSKKAKGKDVPVHTMRAYMGSGNIIPLILNLSAIGGEHWCLAAVLLDDVIHFTYYQILFCFILLQRVSRF